MKNLNYDPAQAIVSEGSVCVHMRGRYAAFVTAKAHHGTTIEVAYLSNTSRVTADGQVDQRPAHEFVPDVIWSRFIPAHSNTEMRTTVVGAPVDPAEFKAQVAAAVKEAREFIDGQLRGLLNTIEGTLNDYRSQGIPFRRIGPVLVFEQESV